VSGLSASYIDAVYIALKGELPPNLVSSEKAKVVIEISTDPKNEKPLPVSEEIWLRCLCEIACRTYFTPEQSGLRNKLQAKALELMTEPFGMPDFNFQTADAEKILADLIAGKGIEDIGQELRNERHSVVTRTQ
jgi:hypothetical protein